MSHPVPALLLLALAPAALAACEPLTADQDPAGAGAQPSLPERLWNVNRDLALGDRGDDVRAVQDYLTAHGYFPSDELPRRFPTWRPIVSTGPAQPGVFDASTAAAVRAFQDITNVPSTGIVDQATRAMLREPGCGVPEGVRAVDPDSKFALMGPRWEGITLLTWTYSHAGAPTNIDEAGTIAAIKTAFATWSARTNLSFQKTSSNARINFVWGPTPNDALAVTTVNPSNGVGQIITNPAPFRVTWTLNGPQLDRRDLPSNILHEIGHALGLLHSSVGARANTVMAIPLVDNVSSRVLGSDDILAISALYNPWQIVPGCVKDVAVGNDQSVWVIGCDNVAQKRNNNGTWSATNPVQTGSAIAVEANGRPWVVALNGQIVRRSSNSASSGQWIPVANTCARDIGANGAVWAVWCGSGPDGVVVKYNGSSFVSDATGFVARRISVESLGAPWAVRADGTVWRRDSNNAGSGSWARRREGWFFGPNADIGVALSGDFVQAWVTDTIDSLPDIWVWNEQRGNQGDPSDPRKEDWVRVPGHSERVAVGPNNPWVVALSTGGISPMLRRPAHP